MVFIKQHEGRHAMVRMRNYYLLIAACVLFIVGLADFCSGDTLAEPEVNLYVTHNNVFRSRVAAALTFSEAQGNYTGAAVEYDLDIALMSFFRRYVYKDPNTEKTKFLTMRLGYAYMPDMTSDKSADDEQRGITELTLRLPVGRAWLISDRTRVDYRYIGADYSNLYRNQIAAERATKIGSMRLTPYLKAEATYDTRLQDWSRTAYTAGAEFPLRYSFVFEISGSYRDNRYAEDDRSIGITLQKHILAVSGNIL